MPALVMHGEGRPDLSVSAHRRQVGQAVEERPAEILSGPATRYAHDPCRADPHRHTGILAVLIGAVERRGMCSPSLAFPAFRPRGHCDWDAGNKKRRPKPPFSGSYAPPNLVQLRAEAFDAIADQVASALFVQTGCDQLVRRCNGGISGKATDLVQGRRFSLSDFFFRGSCATGDLCLESGTGFRGELYGFGLGGCDDLLCFRLGAGSALLIVGEQGGGFRTQALGFFQLSRDYS